MTVNVAEPNTPLFPVVATVVGTVADHDLILMRVEFLAHSMQDVAQPDTGRFYAMTRQQALTLVEQIQSRLAALARAAPTLPPGPRH